MNNRNLTWPEQLNQALALNKRKEEGLLQLFTPGEKTQSGMRLGIMGGTFDPIHHGHLVTAETVRSLYALQAVVFIPTGQPPHKEHQQISSASQRYEMTLLATTSNPFFWVSRQEIDRPGYSYTVDTVAEIARQVAAGVELFFITGADAIWEILHWKKTEELTRLCTLVAATRPGFDLSDQGLDAEMPEYLRQRIKIVQVPSLAISSTDIRQRLREKVSIRYLLPDLVRDYVETEELYGDFSNPEIPSSV